MFLQNLLAIVFSDSKAETALFIVMAVLLVVVAAFEIAFMLITKNALFARKSATSAVAEGETSESKAKAEKVAEDPVREEAAVAAVAKNTQKSKKVAETPKKKAPVEEPVPVEEPAPAEEPMEESGEDEFVEIVEEIGVHEAQTRMKDAEAELHITEGTHFADRTKSAIVNIDTLSRAFESGETADLAEMKKRIPTIGKNTTFVKVLARGKLDKALTVEADDFSLDAVKMIILTGGKVIRSRRN